MQSKKDCNQAKPEFTAGYYDKQAIKQAKETFNFEAYGKALHMSNQILHGKYYTYKGEENG